MAAPVHHYGSVASTMDLLHALAAEGAVEGTAVVAEEQLAGRGSRGRAWQSPPGGLWLSLLLRPGPVGADLLGLRVGLTVVEALEAMAPGRKFGLKWPNDVMLGEGKLGGILCEARWTGDSPAWIAVGVGLNVRNPVSRELIPPAVALEEVLPEATPALVLDALLPRLRRLDVTGARLDRDELERLAFRDWLRGRRLIGPVAGRADGIAGDGALQIRRDDGSVVELRAGSVQLVQFSNPA